MSITNKPAYTIAGNKILFKDHAVVLDYDRYVGACMQDHTWYFEEFALHLAKDGSLEDHRKDLTRLGDSDDWKAVPFPFVEKNQVIFKDHKVVFDPELYGSFKEAAAYLEEMRESLTDSGSAEDHEEELDRMNNDGTWTVEKLA